MIMSSLRQFSGTRPLYTLADDGLLTNNQSGVKYRPNNDSGYYQSINADGSWGDEKLSPGYTVTIGAKNFTRVFTDEGIQKPFSLSSSGPWSFGPHCGVNCGGWDGIGLPRTVGSAER